MQPLMSIIMDENKEEPPIPDTPQQTKNEKLDDWLAQAFAIGFLSIFASTGVYYTLSYCAIIPALPDFDPSNRFNNQSISNSNFANQLALYSFCQALLQQSSTGNSSTAAGGASGENSLVCTQILERVDMSQLVAQAFPGLVLPTSTADGSPGAASTVATATATSGSSAAPLISTQAGAILASLIGGVALVVPIWSILWFRQRLYSHSPRV